MTALKICPQCGVEYELDRKFCPNDGSALKLQGSGDDLVGQIIADRYHVLKKLGEGGMGQVYLAEHVKMGRKSAVKVMHPGMVHDADAITRFNREAANASRINHPNVAAIYDFGETSDGVIYLAMEFIEGGSLTSLIERQGALPPPRAGNITRQTADGLTVAHELGIVHRDLKPDNIMIARGRDGSDVVKVVDFGIAKATHSEAQNVTKTGLVVGTPEYMSPEQLAGDKMDGRSDIYSLGLVAFAMLTGKLPFPSETVQESMIMRLTDRPRTLGEMKPDVAWPAELQTVMDRALARDVNERYQVAKDFGRDIEHAVAGMPMQNAAEAGTMVLGAASIPATRVSTAGSGATMKAGAVKAPAAGGGTALATPVAAKGGRGLMIGIAAAVLAVGGGGAYFALKGGADTGTPAAGATTSPPSASPSGADGSQGSPSQGAAPTDAPAASTPSGSPAQSQSGGGQTSPPASKTGAGAPPSNTYDNVTADLARLNRDLARATPSPDSVDKDLVTGVVARASLLEGRHMSPSDSVQWRWILAQAWGHLEDYGRACKELRSLNAQRNNPAIADTAGIYFVGMVDAKLCST